MALFHPVLVVAAAAVALVGGVRAYESTEPQRIHEAPVYRPVEPETPVASERAIVRSEFRNYQATARADADGFYEPNAAYRDLLEYACEIAKLEARGDSQSQVVAELSLRSVSPPVVSHMLDFTNQVASNQDSSAGGVISQQDATEICTLTRLAVLAL
jgi:hypothetical protein